MHLLCASLLDGLALPAAHRNVLAAAFGLTSEPRPEATVVGLATLDLLTSIAESQPVCLVIDGAKALSAAVTSVFGANAAIALSLRP